MVFTKVPCRKYRLLGSLVVLLQTVLLYRHDTKLWRTQHQPLFEGREIPPLRQLNHVNQPDGAKSPEEHRRALAGIGYGGRQHGVICCRTLEIDDCTNRFRHGAMYFVRRVGFRRSRDGRRAACKRIHYQKQCRRSKRTSIFPTRVGRFHFLHFLRIQTIAIVVRNSMYWEEA